MVMPGKFRFSSDMRGLEVLNGVAVPRQASAHRVGKLGDPDTSILFEVRDDSPVCVEIVVKAKPDGRGVRGADLERLNLSRLAGKGIPRLRCRAHRRSPRGPRRGRDPAVSQRHRRSDLCARSWRDGR